MRLIDADALKRHGNRGGLVQWKDIEEAPTIDLEEIKHMYFQIGYMEAKVDAKYEDKDEEIEITPAELHWEKEDD